MAMSGDSFTGSSRRFLVPCLVLLCVVLLTSNLVLLQRARKIQRVYDALREFTLQVKPGTHVPAIEGFDVGGRWASVGVEGQRPLVVFVFSPRCAFSDRNWPNWTELLPAVEHTARTVFVDASRTADPAYLGSHPTGKAIVIAKPDAKAVASYTLSMTPQTILVDSRGMVRKVWSGVLTDSDVADIRATLERTY
jgi:hypothetical protein